MLRFRITVILAGLAIVGISGSAMAATFVSGTVSASDNSGSVNNSVSSVPYSTPAVAPVNTEGNSTTTPDFTGLVFKTTFAQNLFAVSDPTSGASSATFTANTGDTYSLFGSSQLSTGTSSFTVTLFDNTTSTNIFSQSPAYDDTGNATADSGGGPTFGDLQAGSYTFSISDSLTPTLESFFQGEADAVDPIATITGSGGITLVSTGSPAVPEPGTAGLLLIIAGASLPIIRRRHPTPLPATI